MKYLLLGIFLALIGVLASLVIWEIEMVSIITSGMGLFLIVLSFIFSGVLVSGDRMRANLATESVEDRQRRNTLSFRLALIAIPSFAVAISFYYFLN